MANNTNKSNRGEKKEMAIAGAISFGAAILGTLAQSGVTRTAAKMKEKPTLLDKLRERKRLMYLKGEAIHREYVTRKENIRESAVINAKVAVNNKQTVSVEEKELV
ncbi:hypothetical protein QR721_03275 [Aciduricibacillus chroicocephali]|uniref:Uncharacterized protein n=1 Tax=Aciduricibacillus chroicocephali TaxID=3054939 RepID=A0ABY9KWK3_9BACI|nr:hypothetical protein QR721_03275 [Bacillaceae bacterium 44XB]